MAPDVTAVIAVYNGGDLIKRAIDSVLAQTSPVRELIVVDDGSVDDTGRIVASYGSRVTCMRQENRGVAAARNSGTMHARATWVAFLDHDDEWLPKKVERQLACVAANPGVSVCYSAYHFHFLDGTASKVHVSLPQARSTMRLRCPFPPTVMMARRDALLALGGYNEKLKGASCEDWDLAFRLLNHYEAAALEEPLANHYEVDSSNSVRHYDRMLANTLAIVEPTLLTGLTGVNRILWRRRIQGALYHRAAISARQLDRPAAPLLINSIARWPVPDSRLKMLALEVGRMLEWR